MSVEGTQSVKINGSRKLRADEGKGQIRLPSAKLWRAPALVLIGLIFVVVGGADSDLRAPDARIGLAAKAGLSPLGQVYGQWRPDIWPLPVAASQLALLLERPGQPSSGTVLWPTAIAGLIAGWLVARRLMNLEATRLGLLFAFAWFGSLALLDHSNSIRVDFIAGMATIAALDRLIARGSGWVAGLWTSLAFLAAGWPPLVIVGLAVIVLGRRDADFSLKLIAPPVLVATLWFVWAARTASVEAAAAALAWPLTQKPAWTLGLDVFAIGLPLAPFALLLISGALRKTLRESGRGMVVDWLQIGLAAAIGGSLIPGLAPAARCVALMGILVAAAAGMDAAWARNLSGGARRAFWGVTLALTGLWTFAAVFGGYLTIFVFPYYRPVGIAAAILSVVAIGCVGWALEAGNARRSVIAMLLLTACVKLLHWGYYVPEWNYRYGQGPWGRAIAQWMMPNWTLYTTHEWSEELAWAIGRPVRQLTGPRHLSYAAPSESKHVLLLEPEFDNWPDAAPKLTKVAAFETPYGGRRILARTEGVLLSPDGREMRGPTGGRSAATK